MQLLPSEDQPQPCVPMQVSSDVIEVHSEQHAPCSVYVTVQAEFELVLLGEQVLSHQAHTDCTVHSPQEEYVAQYAVV